MLLDSIFLMPLRTALLVGVIMSPNAPVESAEIRFHSDCVPAGNLVRLGDVADIVTDDKQLATSLAVVELFPAPAAGDRLVVTAREICDRLELKRINLAPHLVGGARKINVLSVVEPRVQVAPKLRVSDTQRQQARLRIRTAILEHLGKHTPVTDAWKSTFELSDTDVRDIVHSSGKPVAHGGSEPWTGAQGFTIRLSVTDSEREIKVSAEITAAGEIVVAIRPLGRGVVIGRADVRLETPANADAAEGAFSRLEDVIGSETVKTIGADKPVTTDAVQAQLLIRRREVVTVFVRSPGIRIRTTCRAVDDGAQGDLITVESLTDRKTYFARVCGPQEVEVYSGGGEAKSNVREREPVATAARGALSMKGR